MAINLVLPIIYNFKSQDDMFYGTSLTQSFNGGLGNDTVSYENSKSGIFANLNEDNRLGFGYGKGGDAKGDFYVNIENITGSNFNDGFVGNDKDNIFRGLNGDDYFHSSKGLDSFFGGNGIDTVSYASNNQGIRVELSIGQVHKGASDGYDYLDNIEKVYGTDYEDFFYGDDQDNSFFGNAGNDFFYADRGADLYDGGTGTDTINYHNSSSAVRVNLETGEGSGGDAAGDQYVDLEKVIGSNYDDTLIASDEGSDLLGNRGEDTLIGGDGMDRLMGGDDDDTIEGNDDKDTLNGGRGNDLLDGGNGADFIQGGSGADEIIGGSDIDTAVYDDYSSNGNRTTEDGINVRLDQGFAYDLFGDRDTLTFVENIKGSIGNDLIVGDDKNNTLNGNAGNDILNGQEGDDHLIGASGEDTFVFNNNDGRNGLSHGQDMISDFDIEDDLIDLSDTEVRNFNDLFSEGDRYMEQVGQDTVIYTMNGEGGDSITLQNLNMASLTEDNFIF